MLVYFRCTYILNALDFHSFIPVPGDIPLSYPINPFYPTIQVGGDILTFLPYIIELSEKGSIEKSA